MKNISKNEFNKTILLSPFGTNDLIHRIQKKLECEMGEIEIHTFPDKETLVHINSKVKDSNIILITSLNHPNFKIFPLISAADTARELRAKKITLVTPYLAYMRQDRSFHEGEAITSKQFAKLISFYFDNLITMDPHLHRFHSLNEIFQIPTEVLHATSFIAQWIKENVKNPFIIGPDIESKQWVSEVARINQAPYVILDKIRENDRLVKLSIPDIEKYHDNTPILIDDIISSGITMLESIRHLKNRKMEPICIAIHGIFADNAYASLQKAGAKEIVTCNTIEHESNKIDVSEAFVEIISKNNLNK